MKIFLDLSTIVYFCFCLFYFYSAVHYGITFSIKDLLLPFNAHFVLWVAYDALNCSFLFAAHWVLEQSFSICVLLSPLALIQCSWSGEMSYRGGNCLQMLARCLRERVGWYDQAGGYWARQQTGVRERQGAALGQATLYWWRSHFHISRALLALTLPSSFVPPILHPAVL